MTNENSLSEIDFALLNVLYVLKQVIQNKFAVCRGLAGFPTFHFKLLTLN